MEIAPILSETISIKSHLLSTHITALKFVKDSLLLGEGNQIKCFNWRRKQYMESVRVFESSSVHGIRIVSTNQESVKLVVFGAKSLRIFGYTLKENERLTALTNEQHLEDWIHDVQGTLSNIDMQFEQVNVITAHNSLILWDYNKSKVKKQFHCLEKCILYSATILDNKRDCFIIAAGTVFKEVVIWSPNVTDTNNRIAPFHRLAGHQGVIFSISYNAHLKLLCTTSDDRGLRLWKFSCSENSGNSDSNLSLCDWREGSFHLIQSSFAHESRVWRSVILSTCAISIGEDSTVCFWTHTGKLITKEKCHRGGSIWCVDISEDNLIAATGGSDSGVSFWNIPQITKENCAEKIARLTEVLIDDDVPRSVALIPSNMNSKQQSILYTTKNGKLISCNLSTNDCSVVYNDPLHSSYNLLSVSPGGIIVLLGSLDGTVNTFQHDNGQFFFLKKWKAVEGKVHGIFWLAESSRLALICGLKGQLTLWSIQMNRQECVHTKECDIQLPESRHWWATSSCHVPSIDSLVVGDGNGSVHIYSKLSVCETKTIPCYTFPSLHGMHGVTDIQLHSDLIYTAGRDGRVMCYNITLNGLTLLHRVKVLHDLEWLVKLLFVEDDLLVLGFYTTNFIVWSSKNDRVLMKVDCGGGHRSWDFSLSSDHDCNFVSIKRKEFIHTRASLKFLFDESVIQTGVCGMALCCTCYLFDYTDRQFGKMSILACGGEDPALKFIGVPHTKNSISSGFILMHSISGHLSSIKAIAKCAVPEKNTFLMITAGGRAQMIAWLVMDKKGLVCEQIVSDFLWNFDKLPQKNRWREKLEPVSDPQTRYMSVVVWPSNQKPESVFCIALACSDTFIRLHTINILEKKLEYYFVIPYGQHCVLNLSLMLHEDHSAYLASAGNDGNFKIYDCAFVSKPSESVLLTNPRNYEKNFVSVSFEPVFQMSVHQSGVNALDTMYISDENWLICSGGDDNALSVVMFHIIKNQVPSDLIIIASGSYANAHASQITGVKILSKSQLISASIDQRLNCWQIKRSGKILEFQILRSVICSIPDIAHLEMWSQEKEKVRNLVVCGQGFENLQLVSSSL